MPALLIILLGSLLFLPGSVAAQRHGPDVLLLGGSFRPMQPFPSVPDAEYPTAAYLRDGGLALGIGAEWRTPWFPVPLRASWMHASATLHRAYADRSDARLTSATVNTVMFDAIFRGPRLSFVQPHVLVGGGIKTYRLQFTADDEAARRWLGSRSADPALRMGLGADVAFGRYGLLLEASDHMSRFRSRSPDDAPAGYRNMGELQHDLTYTLGLRARLF
jgi:hypothetical protein